MTDLTQHWRLNFDNKYLGAWNLWVAKDRRYTTTTVTIERAPIETVVMQGGRKQRERLLYFVGKRTPLILTRKMGKVIERMYGPVPQDWIGKAITLYVEQGFRTKDGPADVLRVRNEKAGASLAQAIDEDRTPEPPEEFGDAAP
jgi:hypothetical protein